MERTSRVTRDLVLRNAYSLCGVPYQYGGDSIVFGLDCSGFVRRILQIQRLLPRDKDYNSQMLFDYFTGKTLTQDVDCTTEELSPANLMFFGRDNHHIHHVAFIIDANHILEVAHGGRKIRALGEALAADAKVTVSDINRLPDRIAVVDPFVLS